MKMLGESLTPIDKLTTCPPKKEYHICVRVGAIWKPEKRKEPWCRDGEYLVLLQDNTGFILGRAEDILRFKGVMKAVFTFVFHGPVEQKKKSRSLDYVNWQITLDEYSKLQHFSDIESVFSPILPTTLEVIKSEEVGAMVNLIRVTVKDPGVEVSASETTMCHLVLIDETNHTSTLTI